MVVDDVVLEAVLEVVVIGGPTLKVAYLRVKGALCSEYQNPAKSELKVGGRVCLCEPTSPESMTANGAHVVPPSDEKVA